MECELEALNAKSALLVVAHPDDEAMFFAPFLLSAATTCKVYLLCLSSGNFEGLGEMRKRELATSAQFFRLAEFEVIEHEQLQDGMQEHWPPHLIASIVRDRILSLGCELVVTFDEQGVSKHPNHIATSYGVQMAVQSARAHSHLRSLRGMKLITTNIVRKFIGIFDVLLSLLGEANVMLNFNLFKVYRGMLNHRSQFVWYRRLFVVFSRYSYVNTFQSF